MPLHYFVRTYAFICSQIRHPTSFTYYKIRKLSTSSQRALKRRSLRGFGLPGLGAGGCFCRHSFPSRPPFIQTNPGKKKDKRDKILPSDSGPIPSHFLCLFLTACFLYSIFNLLWLVAKTHTFSSGVRWGLGGCFASCCMQLCTPDFWPHRCDPGSSKYRLQYQTYLRYLWHLRGPRLSHELYFVYTGENTCFIGSLKCSAS